MVERLTTDEGLIIYHRGPLLSEGPLPTVIYFAVTGDESLTVDPFSTPVDIWVKAGIRVFSISLPLHNSQLPHKTGMARWAKEIRSGNDILLPFIKECKSALDYIINENLVDSARISTAGLSRGGYIATLFAAHDARVSTILGFAPVTNLAFLRDFSFLTFDETSVEAIKDRLTKKQIKYFISNHDELVNTKCCIESLLAIVNSATKEGIRSPKIEFSMYPPIGFKGHGTPLPIFIQGANWLISLLKAST